MELNLESTSAKMDCPTQKNLGTPLGMFLAPSLRGANKKGQSWEFIPTGGGFGVEKCSEYPETYNKYIKYFFHFKNNRYEFPSWLGGRGAQVGTIPKFVQIFMKAPLTQIIFEVETMVQILILLNTPFAILIES